MNKKRYSKPKIHILDSRSSIEQKDVNIAKERVAIVVNLYYTDSMEFCVQYLSELAAVQYHIYIFSSNNEILEKTCSIFTNQENVFVLPKKNRGRDLSALLVSFRPYLEKYEYVCFTHDKKAKNLRLESDTKFWMRNMWENLLASRKYVEQVLLLLQEYGALLIPKPLGKFMNEFYRNPWGATTKLQ